MSHRSMEKPPYWPRYATGGFDFPTTTGPFTVTGLRFRPKIIVLFGSNRPEVDTPVFGLTSPGIFVSIAALDYFTMTTLQYACLAPMGNSDANWLGYRGAENAIISMPADGTDASVVDYRASTLTLIDGGFTIQVTKAATGRRPIHWLAIGNDFADPLIFWGAGVKQKMDATYTFTNAFRAMSSMVLSTIATNGFGEGAVNRNVWFSFGTSHFPLLAPATDQWGSALTFANIQLESPAGRQGYNRSHVMGSSVDVSHVVNGLGPVLIEGFRRHRPTALGSMQMVNEGGGAGTPWQMCVWWNGEGWVGTIDTPSTPGAILTIPARNGSRGFMPYEAILFSTVNGPDSNTDNKCMRLGMGCLHPLYQGCVAFGQDGSFFQSTSRAFCNVDAVHGARTAWGEVSKTGAFRLTTDLGGSSARGVFHGFGGLPE